MDLILVANNSLLYSCKRLQEEAKAWGANPQFITPNQHQLQLTDPFPSQASVVIHRATGMLFDDFDLLISGKLEQAGATIINPIEVMRRFRDKERQAQELSALKLPTIPSLSLRGKVGKKDIEAIQSLGNPEQFILKTIRGNQGIGVNLINGKESLASLLETFWAIGDQRFLVQPYIKSSREYRILLGANRVLGTIEKVGGDFRKNAKRSPARFLKASETPQEVLKLAQNCYQKSKAIIAGIDIIENDDKLYVLEINLVPGFKQMEELSSLNIAREFISIAMEATK